MERLGSYRHLVTVQNPGPPQPDGDGGYTEGWASASPAAWNCSITPATVRDLERLTAGGTVLSTATHLVRGRFHPQITTSSRLQFGSRFLNVIYVGNPEERNLECVLVCAEVLSGQPGVAGPAISTPPPVWDNA